MLCADGDCNVYFQCVRCPTAYHADPQQKCVAAGSQSVAGLNIVCPRHFEPVKSNTHHARVHTSWCCVCQLGKICPTLDCISRSLYHCGVESNIFFFGKVVADTLYISAPLVGSGVERIDLQRFLVGCCRR